MLLVNPASFSLASCTLFPDHFRHPFQEAVSALTVPSTHNMDNAFLGKNLVCTLFVCKGVPSDTVDDSRLLW